MSHLVVSEPWGTVDLDLKKGHVFVRQDWQYRWKFQMLMRPWSDDERTAFHRTVDRQVWRTWSMHARLMVAPKPSGGIASHGQVLAQTCGSRGLTLSFDVRRVEVAPHWRVNVLKLESGVQKRAWVDERRFVVETVEKEAYLFDASSGRTLSVTTVPALLE